MIYNKRPIYDDFGENPFESIPKVDYDRLSSTQKENYNLAYRNCCRRQRYLPSALIPSKFTEIITEDSPLQE